MDSFLTVVLRRNEMLLPSPIMLGGSVHFVTGRLEALLHRSLGVGYPHGEFVFLLATHDARRARICLVWCSQWRTWKRSHSGSVRSPSAGFLTNRSVARAGSSSRSRAR